MIYINFLACIAVWGYSIANNSAIIVLCSTLIAGYSAYSILKAIARQVDRCKKTVVHYYPTDMPIIVGECAYVKTIDHPILYFNTVLFVATSPVLWYDNGYFETINLLYVPLENL